MRLHEILTKIAEDPFDSFWPLVWKRYYAAQDSRAAKEAGIIGVGLITFAEHRVDVFLRRCGR